MSFPSRFSPESRTSVRLRLSILSLVAWMWIAAPHVHAADLIVDDLGDTMALDGVCTLREAIAAANNNADYLDCVGSGPYGDDTITISVPGEIVMNIPGTHEDGNQTGDFDISGTLTIVGLGSGEGAMSTTISGNNLDRVFEVHTGDFSIEGVRIREGRTPSVPEDDHEGSGGGILSRAVSARFDMIDCVIEENVAANCGGGFAIIGSYPDCRVHGCSILRNQAIAETGGGISITGYTPTVEIVDSLVEENLADEGGGFFSNVFHIDLTVERSAIKHNEAVRYGGGMCVVDWGRAKIEISDATISNNTARIWGGVLFEFSQLEWDPVFQAAVTVNDTSFLENETKTENGGAVAFRSAQTYKGMIADATFHQCRFERNRARIGGAAFHNQLTSDSTYKFTDCFFVENACLLGSGAAILNGGVNTHLVMAGGQLIGNLGPAGGGAISSSAARSRLELSDLIFRENRTERGNGGALLLTGYGDSRPSLLIEDCTIESCSSGGHGGGVSVTAGSATAEIHSCTLVLNEAAESGGGFHLGGQPDDIVIEGSFFAGNASGREGGGIANFSETGRLAVTDSTLRENTSETSGGGFHDEGLGAAIEIADSTIEANSCEEVGGGCRFATGAAGVLVSGCVIRDNTTAESGAGIAVQLVPGIEDNEPAFVRCQIQNNQAQRFGGGVFSGRSSAPRLVNCGVFENQAMSGGGVTSLSSRPELVNCVLTANGAHSLGGGIHSVADSGFSCVNSILWNNGTEIEETLNGSSNMVRYSCIQGGWPGEGNQADDPGFVDPLVDDYHLDSDSPCIDTGEPDSAFNDGGLPPGEGGPRNDMGVFGGPYNLAGQPASGDAGPISILDSTISGNVSLGNGGGVFVSTTELSAGLKNWSLYE